MLAPKVAWQSGFTLTGVFLTMTITTSSHLIELRSDNAAGAAPEILAALANANVGSARAYGADDWTHALEQRVREVFEHPTARVFPVLTGTAANAIGLSALCQPWGSVLCHETAHILRSECGSTSMFSAGAVMRPLEGDQYRVSTNALEAAFASTRWGDAHHSQPMVLSLTNPTDFGTVYDPGQIEALATLARSRGLRVHMDGARLANAIARLGCTPAALTWRAGVDMVSLGATKNGALTADAIVCFDETSVKALEYRLKRAGQVASKMRFQSVQLDAYLQEDRWLRWAGQANRVMDRLVAGLDRLAIELLVRPQVNMAFVRVDEPIISRLEAAGLLFYRSGPGLIRLVTSFQTTDEAIDQALERLAQCC